MFTNLLLIAKLRLQFSLLIFCIPFLLLPQEKLQENTKTTSNHLKTFVTTSKSTKKIKKLIRDALFKEKDTMKSLELAKLFLKRGVKERDDTIQYFSAYQIGYIAYNTSSHLEVIPHLQQALTAAHNLKDTTRIIHSNILIGSSYYLLGAYHASIRHYLEAKKLTKLKKNNALQLVCLTNLANNRLKLNRIVDALFSFNEIIELLQNGTDKEFIVYKKTLRSALLGKGKCLAELKRETEALHTLNSLIKMAEEDGDIVSKGYAYVNIGDIFYNKEEYQKALNFLNEAKEILLNNAEAQKTNLYITNYYIAKCYAKQKRYEESLQLLTTNFSSIENKEDVDKIESMYELAIEIAKGIGDQTKQIYYYDQLQNIVQLKSEKQLAARDLLFEEDLKIVEEENETLKKENDKSELRKDAILIISALILLILLSVFIVYRKQTKRKERRFLALINELESKSIESKQKEIPLRQNGIKDEKAEKIIRALHELEKTKFYLSKDCNLYATAKLLKTNTTYLSKALNKFTKQPFNQYLNELRINYALLQLKEDPLFRSYTIRAVASEVGYKSHTTFIKVFKEKTGVTPSYYIKKLG